VSLAYAGRFTKDEFTKLIHHIGYDLTQIDIELIFDQIRREDNFITSEDASLLLMNKYGLKQTVMCRQKCFFTVLSKKTDGLGIML